MLRKRDERRESSAGRGGAVRMFATGLTAGVLLARLTPIGVIGMIVLLAGLFLLWLAYNIVVELY